MIPLIVCFSCESDRQTASDEMPVNLIPAENMIPILVDLQILESHFQRLHQRPELYKNALDSSSALIFQDYQVSKGAFDSSYMYYANNVNVLHSIYEAALDSLNFRMEEPQQ